MADLSINFLCLHFLLIVVSRLLISYHAAFTYFRASLSARDFFNEPRDVVRHSRRRGESLNMNEVVETLDYFPRFFTEQRYFVKVLEACRALVF